MSSDTVAIEVRTLRRLALVILASLILAGLAILIYQQRERLPGFASGVTPYVDGGAYQAVFLVSAQVYFGRLSVPNSELYLLSDVYYLDTPPQGEQQGRLLKRGGELHGPRDPMLIPARSVLYIENVRDDSEVMAAIRRFQKGEAPAAPAATARPSPTR